MVTKLNNCHNSSQQGAQETQQSMGLKSKADCRAALAMTESNTTSAGESLNHSLQEVQDCRALLRMTESNAVNIDEPLNSSLRGAQATRQSTLSTTRENELPLCVQNGESKAIHCEEKKSNIKKITDLDIRDKKVILRLDLNLPIVKGKVTDLYRLNRSLPTLEYLIKNGAKIIILSHFGRPKGKFCPGMSLAPIVDTLSSALGGREIKFLLNILSADAADQINLLKSGEIILAENIRFHKEEEDNDLDFAKKIADLGEVYINEAFSVSHRSHATIASLPCLLPSGVGFLFAEELETLEKYLTNPVSPVLALTGGSKISSKIKLLKSLVKKVDVLVIGGAMANTFLKAQGYSIGKSMHESNQCELAQEIIKSAKSNNCSIILPYDVVTAYSMNDDGNCRVANISDIKEDEMILDVGPSFIFNILNCLNKAQTVIWNGPLGAFEHTPFDIGTSTISRAIAGLTSYKNLISIAGGGDVVSAINSTQLAKSFTYISTGGGAFLKWLEGGNLPALNKIIIEKPHLVQ
jgi:phosphoglycerate kinase